MVYPVPIWFPVSALVLLAADRAPLEALPAIRGGELNAGESGALPTKKGSECLGFPCRGIQLENMTFGCPWG